MFIDASALCAILLNEEDAAPLGERIGRATLRLTSHIAVMEAALALGRQKDSPFSEGRATISRFLTAARIEIVDIGPAEREAALDASGRFGKGRHPAKLNMGDCFAYACARTHGVPLLFKGNDFSQTDIEAA